MNSKPTKPVAIKERSPSSDVSVSSSPTVTSSGHMFWNIRDIIFSDSRRAAEAALEKTRPKQERK